MKMTTEKAPRWTWAFARSADLCALAILVPTVLVISLARNHHALLAAAVLLVCAPIYAWAIYTFHKWRIVRLVFSIPGTVVVIGLAAAIIFLPF